MLKLNATAVYSIFFSNKDFKVLIFYLFFAVGYLQEFCINLFKFFSLELIAKILKAVL
jgi:hypothetical protein